MLTILLFLLFFRPFICSLAFPYQNLIFSLITLFFSLLWLVKKKDLLKPYKKFIYLFLLISATMLLSSLLAPSQQLPLGQIIKYLNGALIFLICASLPQKEISSVMGALITTGLFVSCCAIYQHFFISGDMLDLLYSVEDPTSNIFALLYQQRSFLPFLTPNVLGGFLILIIPLALSLDRFSWLSAPLLLALFLSRSIGASIALLLSLSLIFLFSLRQEHKLHKICIASLLLLSLLILSRSFTTFDRFHPIFSLNARIEYWRETLTLIKQSPWTGIGIGNFDLTNSRCAHNLYLQLWATFGLLGLTSFLALIGSIVIPRAKSLWKKSARPLPLALLCSAFAFLLHNFLDITFFLPEVSLLWWGILGLLANKHLVPAITPSHSSQPNNNSLSQDQE